MCCSKAVFKGKAWLLGAALLPLLLGIDSAGLGAQEDEVSVEGETTVEAETGEITLATIVVRGQLIEGTVEEGYKVESIQYNGPWGRKSLLDSPYSVNVMSSDLIKNLAIKTEDDIFRISSNVQMVSPVDVGGAVFSIRGFSSGRGASDSRYQDGLHVANNSPMMEDKDRVEILSGTSGFLYGPGAVGGLMNYVLKRPPTSPVARLSLGGYGGGNFYTHLDLGGPLGEDGRFGYRLNLGGQDGETAVEDNKLRRSFLSGAFDWYINDDMTLQFNAAYAKKKAVNVPVSWYMAAGAARPAAFDAGKNWNPTNDTYMESSSTEFGLNYKWEVNEHLTLRSAYRHGRYDREGALVYMNTFQPGGGYSTRVMNYNPESYVQDVGYLYTDLKFDTGPLAHQLTLGGSVDSYTAETKNVTNNGDHRIRDTDKELKTNVIIGDEIRIGDSWTVLAGLNFANIKKRTYNVKTGANTADFTNYQTSPTFSVLYKPIPEITVYGTYMESLTRGTVVGSTYLNYGEVLDAYVSEEYEVGLKAELDGLMLTLALFQIEKANQYARTVNSLGDEELTQDGRQRHRGLELSATGKVFEDLTLYGGLTLMKAEVSKTENKANQGKKPANVPETVAKVYAEYALPFLDGFSLTGGAYYSGKKYGDAANNDKIGGATVFDLGARYKTEMGGAPVTFRVNVANLTDKNYWTNSYYFGSPRTVTFYMDFDF